MWKTSETLSDLCGPRRLSMHTDVSKKRTLCEKWNYSTFMGDSEDLCTSRLKGVFGDGLFIIQ